MSKTSHIIFISILVLIVLTATIILIYSGYSYYQTSLEERFYHNDYQILKPSGIWGHGYGIIGSLFMLIGVTIYMMRKRARFMRRLGLVKHWLEFHIFLCTLGPLLVLFHTSFKFGGLVAISFWSMVAVFLSGIIGRFIYIQIPRTIEGRELSLKEVKVLKTDIGNFIRKNYSIDDNIYSAINESLTTMISGGKKTILTFIKNYISDKKLLRRVGSQIKHNNLKREDSRKIIRLIKEEISLNRRISRLNTMQNLFKYWHVAHLPFALIMLIIMIIHVAVTIVFGYKWIF